MGCFARKESNVTDLDREQNGAFLCYASLPISKASLLVASLALTSRMLKWRLTA